MKVKFNLLLLITFLTLAGCSEDKHVNVDELNDHLHEHGFYKNADDIPHILDYLTQRTDGTMRYGITENNITPLNHSSRTDTSFGTVNTDQVVEVTNETNTKYTFGVDTPDENGEYINLVVVEDTSGLQDYVIKYIPDPDWLLTQRGAFDMSTYTGEVKVYDFNGTLVSEITMAQGTSTYVSRAPVPCPQDNNTNENNDNTNDNTNDGTGGDGSGGGGSGGEDPDGSEGGSDLPPDDGSGNTGGGSGGGGGSCVITFELNICCNNNPVVHDKSICGCDPPTGTFYSWTALGCDEHINSGRTTDPPTLEQDPCVVGDVGVLLNIVITPEFSQQYPCQSDIVRQTFVETNGEVSQLILNTFGATNQIDLVYTNGDLPDVDQDGEPDGNAATSPFSNPNSDGVFEVVITLDNQYLQSTTDLSIVAHTLHESIHGYFIYLFLIGELQAPDTEHNTLFNAFMDFYQNSSALTYSELDNQIHNAMIDFMKKIGTNIYNYALNNGYDENSITQEYCEKLAWSTMTGTDAFNEVIPADQHDDYISIGYNEQNNTLDSIGNGCN